MKTTDSLLWLKNLIYYNNLQTIFIISLLIKHRFFQYNYLLLVTTSF
jgi:hypothetical protein